MMRHIGDSSEDKIESYKPYVEHMRKLPRLMILFKSMFVVFLLSAIAGVLSVMVVRWKMERLFDVHVISEDSDVPSLFFYNTIGSSPHESDNVALFPASSAVTEILASSEEAGTLHSVTSAKKPIVAQNFTVKVMIVERKQEAEDLVGELNLSGLPASITSLSMGASAKPMYRVNMGLYRDEKEAQKALVYLQERTSYKGEVIRYP